MNTNVYKTEKGRKTVESLCQMNLKKNSPLNYEQIWIETAEAKTHAVQFGDPAKRPLLMIHGSMSNCCSWLGAVEFFADTFCVYCIDIPGEPGLSEARRLNIKSDEPEKWLVSVIESLKIEQASIIGMSLGSFYALRLASAFPEKVRALSMITTSGISPARTSFIFKALLLMCLGKPGQKLLNRLVYHKTEISDEIYKFQAIVSKHFIPLSTAIPILRDDELRKITAPVQYFGGDSDALLDSSETGKRLKNILPASEIHILKDTGHVILNKFNAIKDFLVRSQEA